MINLEIKNNDCHAALAMTKSVQSGRSLLPESGADAPTVLSAVYTDSTPAKNRQADVPQYGRSMIEMLGVLAIIGVLSVGGIAGYSKAMMKYRINKTIEQITLIAGNVRTFFANQKNYAGLSSVGSVGLAIIKKAKLVPDEMWNSSGNGFENAFGGKIGASSICFGASCYQNDFVIYLQGLPQEACIELATHDWSATSAYAIGDISTASAYGGKIGHNDCITKTTSIYSMNVSYYVHCAASMPMETAIEYCSSADNNVLGLAFH